MGPNEIHPGVLRVLADVAPKPLSKIFEKLWQLFEVLGDWKTLYSSLKGEDLRTVRFTVVHWKVTKQIIPDTMLRHMEDREMSTASPKTSSS